MYVLMLLYALYEKPMFGSGYPVDEIMMMISCGTYYGLVALGWNIKSHRVFLILYFPERKESDHEVERMAAFSMDGLSADVG